MLRNTKKYGWTCIVEHMSFKALALFTILTSAAVLFDASNVFAFTSFHTYYPLNTSTVVCAALTDCPTSTHGESKQQFVLDNDTQVLTITAYGSGRTGNIGTHYRAHVYDSNNTLLLDYTGSVTSNAWQLVDFTSSTPGVLTAGRYYVSFVCDTTLEPTCPGNFYPDAFRWGAKTPSTTYTNTLEYDRTYSAGIEIGADAFFTINDSQAGGTGEDTIEFASTPTPRLDFETWLLSMNLSPSTTLLCNLGYALQIQANVSGVGLCQYGVLYTNSATLQSYDDYSFITPVTPGPQELNYLTKKVPFATGTTWTAYAYIRTPNHNILAQSDSYTFTINGATNGNWNSSWYLRNPSTSSASGGTTYDCDTGHSWFTAGMCNMFITLFYPSDAEIQKFLTKGLQVQNKPPFGYFTVYGAAFNSLISANTSTTSTIGTVDQSAGVAFVGSLSFFQTLRDWVSYLIWLAFGLYVFQRFRTFDYH